MNFCKGDKEWGREDKNIFISWSPIFLERKLTRFLNVIDRQSTSKDYLSVYTSTKTNNIQKCFDS